MEVNIPEPADLGSEAGALDLWRPKNKSCSYVRIFPFEHDGELHLAAENVVHFTGDGPRQCIKEGCHWCSDAKDDPDLKPSTRYDMVIVDVEDDPTLIRRWSAPHGVYVQIHSFIKENGVETFVGNKAYDIKVDYDNDRQGSKMYAISFRMKSKTLKIDEDTVPDMIAWVEGNRNADNSNPAKPSTKAGNGKSKSKAKPESKQPEKSDATEEVIFFMTEEGDVLKGENLNRTRKTDGKLAVRLDGRVRWIYPDDIVDDVGE